MSITASAIRNDRLTYLALIVLVLGGVLAFNALPRSEDPGFVVRTALVTTRFPGAGPERVELLVTDKLEKIIQEMPEIDFLSSVSRTGLSQVFVNVKEEYTQMRPIWDDLRRKVEKAEADLPSGIEGPFVDDDFGDVYPIMLAITGDGFSYAELKQTADEIRDELLRLPDVASVDYYGDQAERIFVEYNNARLAEVGLSPAQLKGILEQRNIIISGGTVITGGEDIALEPTGNFESVEDLEQTILQLPGRKEVVYLADLAHIYRDYLDPPSSRMRANGEPCLGLSVAAKEGGNVIVMGEQVKALVQTLSAHYPIGIDFDLVIFQPDLVDQKVSQFVENLGQAIAIVIVVMLFSLGVRTGLVVATLIPSTMLITLLFMSVFGIGLDQISIAALIIALGMLVDNAIVMSESIMVQIAAGKDRFRAAVDSAHELRIPLLTSSLTTAAAFLPIFLAESAVGEYCASLFKVVSIALLTSWALSITLMPMVCMKAIRVQPQAGESSYGSRFYQGYRALLLAGLRHRALTMLGVAIIFAAALVGMSRVPNIFMPGSDSPRLLVELDLPLGTTIEVTESLVAELEAHLRDEYMADGPESEGILSWSTYVGVAGGPRYRLAYDPARDGAEHASMIITATSREFVDAAIPELMAWCENRHPDLSQSWKAEQMGPPVTNPIAVRLYGRDTAQLFDLTEKVKAKLETIAGIWNIDDDWGPRTKKLRVNIDQPRARRAGVTSEDVAISLSSGLSGIVTTEYREDDKIIPIVLRSVAADRRDVGKLESMNVFVQATGASLPLKQIADIEVMWEPSKILRRDRYRAVTVGCDIEGVGTAMGAAMEVQAWLEQESASWPLGLSYEMGGDLESSGEANASINDKLPVAFFIILVLLVSQFNSMRRTAIVLITIPLGLIGVTVGLLSTGMTFGFITLLGVISLAGIIINNAIVLLDRIRLEIVENDLSPDRAVIVSAQRRLRPILLTTMTTIGGLTPLWLFGGAMWESMAVSIIFGLAFATMLTLGVVPVLYSVFFRVRFKGFEY